MSAVAAKGLKKKLIAMKRKHRAIKEADLDSEKSDAKSPRLSFTPLMLAAQQGASEIVSVLLRAGADPNVINEEGASALFYAFATGKHWRKMQVFGLLVFLLCTINCVELDEGCRIL